LLQSADEVILFLFPNEQNRQGIDLLLQSLQVLKNLSTNFVFSPVPDVTEAGMAKVRKIWRSLDEKINHITDGADETNEDEINGSESDGFSFFRCVFFDSRISRTWGWLMSRSATRGFSTGFW